ncbi:heme o synthase [Gammaproteobacteria bacterium]|nr:heme o synthase [Gammaproteobacteria bacterium]
MLTAQLALVRPKTNFKTYLTDLIILTKSKVVRLMILTTMVGMLFAPNHTYQLSTIIGSLFGITCAACAAGMLNQILETNIDKNMNRTQNRPLVQNRISPLRATWGCIGLSILSILCLSLFANLLTLFLTAFSMLGYSWFYTQILKPNTSQNIVIGGLFGAMPPLLGYSALTNTIDAAPLILVSIIYTWTPPHFWCLALTKRDEYQKNNLPMLPVTHGVSYTKTSILSYGIFLIICTQLLFLIEACTHFYFIGANILNILFMLQLIKVYHSNDNKTYMKGFIFSNLYLTLLFTIMILDLIWQALNPPLNMLI